MFKFGALLLVLLLGSLSSAVHAGGDGGEDLVVPTWKKVPGEQRWTTVVTYSTGDTIKINVAIGKEAGLHQVYFYAHRPCIKNKGAVARAAWSSNDKLALMIDCENKSHKVEPASVLSGTPPLPDVVQKKIFESKLWKKTKLYTNAPMSGAFFFCKRKSRAYTLGFMRNDAGTITNVPFQFAIFDLRRRELTHH